MPSRAASRSRSRASLSLRAALIQEIASTMNDQAVSKFQEMAAWMPNWVNPERPAVIMKPLHVVH